MKRLTSIIAGKCQGVTNEIKERKVNRAVEAAIDAATESVEMENDLMIDDLSKIEETSDTKELNRLVQSAIEHIRNKNEYEDIVKAAKKLREYLNEEVE